MARGRFTRHTFAHMRFTALVLVIALLVCGCSMENLDRADSPLTRASAIKRVGVPLPSSAHNVYFLAFAGGLQDLERYVRFDVNQAELSSAVEALVADNNKMLSRSLPYLTQLLSAAPAASPRKEFLPMTWWNPSAVTNGYFRGETDGYALRIWVDEDASRVYVYEND